jgi:hypothetical protein
MLMGPAALGIVDTFNHGGGGPRQVTVVTHNDTGGSDSGPQATQVTEVSGDDQSAPAAAPGPATTPVAIAPSRTSVAVGEPVDVAVDARALADDFDLRVVLVPATAPDTGGDPKTFFADAKSVTATQTTVSLTAHVAGPSEIRLYYIPHFGSTFTLAERAKIEVTGK